MAQDAVLAALLDEQARDGLTDRALAARYGIHHSIISRAKAGQVNFGPKVRRRIFRQRPDLVAVDAVHNMAEALA